MKEEGNSKKYFNAIKKESKLFVTEIDNLVKS